MRVFSKPTTINLVLTELCNVKCRHCLNYWRHYDEEHASSLSFEQMDRLIEMFVANGVFHVVLNGGEPLSKLDLVEYAAKRLLENGISIGLNSNLIIATPDKMRRLRDAGVDHILTSITSHDDATTDFMLGSRGGSLGKIIKGIEATVGAGIRVSANMVIGRPNKDHVHDTGLLAHRLGCERFFGTRMTPDINVRQLGGGEDFDLERDEVMATLDELLRVKADTGMMVGTLVSYPLCMLGDLEKYADFVGRGCPTQAGQRISLNATGEFSACPHESEIYGNVFEIGLEEAWRATSKWRRGELRHPGCQGCDYIDVCGTGCRVAAKVYNGSLDAKDPFWRGKDSFVKPYRLVMDPAIPRKLEAGVRLMVPDTIRFRDDGNFHAVNIRWGNTITLDNPTASWLIERRRSGMPFTLADFGGGRVRELADLVVKGVVVAEEIEVSLVHRRNGVSADPAALSNL